MHFVKLRFCSSAEVMCVDCIQGLEFARRPVLLGSYLIADGIHENDTARSSSVDTGEVGVGEEKVVEEFLETGQVRSCKIPLFKLTLEILS